VPKAKIEEQSSTERIHGDSNTTQAPTAVPLSAAAEMVGKEAQQLQAMETLTRKRDSQAKVPDPQPNQSQTFDTPKESLRLQN
jgi:hypothetical protein